MKRITCVLFSMLLILFGGCIERSLEASVLTDSDLDGWADTQEKETHTNPFDSDTDHDGFLDPEDPDPLHPGILTDPEQKLGVGGPLEYDAVKVTKNSPRMTYVGIIEHYNVTLEDVRLPEECTELDIRFVTAGYGDSTWCSYDIDATPTQVIDFFIENMMYDGWDITYCEWDLFARPQKSYGVMSFQKEGDGEPVYVTITVTGSEESPEHSQFIIIAYYVD